MSGEPGTESEIMELKDLRAQLAEVENDLGTCQDDLADMAQYRENLVDTLQDALNELDDLREGINTTDARAVLNENS